MKQLFPRVNAWVVAALVVLGASNAHAGWGWYHHSGGSGGSWGGYASSGGSYGSGGSHGSGGSYGSWGGYASSGGSWGSHGSSGGFLHRVAARVHHSGGSYGSGGSGGSWGGHASGGSWGSHGGIISRIHARRAAWHSGGSHGSWGSSGGYVRTTVSYGSYGSHGSHGSTGSVVYGSHGSTGSVSYGSHGSHGSSGVSYGAPVVTHAAPVVYESYSQPACDNCSASGGVVYESGSVVEGTVTEGQVAPADVTAPAAPAAAPAAEGAPAGGDSAAADANSTTLSVRVPGDAEVYVNGYRTKSTGSFRRFQSPGLQQDREYTYEVRAVVNQGGTPVAQTKFVTMKAGDEADLGFVFSPASEAKTALTLHVPAEAKVTLAGSETKMAGETRVFTTGALESGKTWDDYVVRVTIERDGKTETKERTITLRGGEQHELAFDFDAVELASNE